MAAHQRQPPPAEGIPSIYFDFNNSATAGPSSELMMTSSMLGSVQQPPLGCPITASLDGSADCSALSKAIGFTASSTSIFSGEPLTFGQNLDDPRYGNQQLLDPFPSYFTQNGLSDNGNQQSQFVPLFSATLSFGTSSTSTFDLKPPTFLAGPENGIGLQQRDYNGQIFSSDFLNEHKTDHQIIQLCEQNNGNSAEKLTEDFTFGGHVTSHLPTSSNSLPDCLQLNSSTAETPCNPNTAKHRKTKTNENICDPRLVNPKTNGRKRSKTSSKLVVGRDEQEQIHKSNIIHSDCVTNNNERQGGNPGEIGPEMQTIDSQRNICCVCHELIVDRFMFSVNNSIYHGTCLKCSECQKLMDDCPTCFVRTDALFCKPCYLQRFQTKCISCDRQIQPTDWVRRARSFLYHLACFSCDHCKRQLSTGEQFSIQDNRLLCKQHYMELVQGDDGHTKQKTKRVRTTFAEEQIDILQAHFQIDCNPDGADLERIAQLTGLSKRVTQVWFQNSRARQKKYQVSKKNGIIRSGSGNSTASVGTTDAASMNSGASGRCSTATTMDSGSPRNDTDGHDDGILFSTQTISSNDNGKSSP
ncbi:LIM domain-containing protein [Ditylenchus destructor]|uniref:LIM domain-containing protein n=1 Tax=Ditylenchus destructor TaxID=166010 RepID=A0AAD4N9N8_9BILA|nr:LIM domain-containing protein [Ditylenchus destructor]